MPPSRTELAILVPALNRPHRVAPLLESIRETTPDAYVLFLCDQGDTDELREVLRADADYECCGGSYAEKINRGVELTEAPLVFLGADDLEHKPGWFEAAKAKLDPAQVVGINDLIPRRRIHATHFLITREYAEHPTIDGGRGPLHEGYGAWFCDDELIGTAEKRGVYAYAQDAHIEHLHPMVGAEDDETYQLGRSQARQDKKRFLRRCALWT